MRIVVNHLTRMQQGYICVAGVDESKQHIRPVHIGARLGTHLLRRRGGPFDIGAVVDLGPVQARPTPPEVEDHVFSEFRAQRVGDMSPADFWNLLHNVARPSLRAIFGEALTQRGHGCTIDVGTGRASLGCLTPKPGSSALVVEQYEAPRLRLLVTDGEYDLSLSVTDLRFYEDDHRAIRAAVVRDVAARLQRGVDLILSVGLARAWRRDESEPYRHWLQVNNLHLADDPLWQDQRR